MTTQQQAYPPPYQYASNTQVPPNLYNDGSHPQPIPGQAWIQPMQAYPAPEQQPLDHPGGSSYNETHAEEGGGGGGFTTAERFSDKNIRRTFIKKVYIVLTIQLMFTFAIVCVFSFVAVFLIVFLSLACIDSLRRKHPLNIIMLGVLTLSLSYMAGTIASYYDTISVIVCVGITMGVCLGVTLFCVQTKFDFTKYIGVAFVLTLALLLFGFIAIFTYSDIVNAVIGLVCALVLVLWLAIDTQLILGGKKHELNAEEYIYAAMTLYIDIVYIFLIILAICGKG
uniref:Protein lifeguard 1-like n=1 Tax=Saccoglossus kowalevskii TaxID=10224 RepID=A0ABM0MW80_SACKO|nr:PREDICTED: protein lifeguard 1-like [Saccoglossus kowalevskii]